MRRYFLAAGVAVALCSSLWIAAPSLAQQAAGSGGAGGAGASGAAGAGGAASGGNTGAANGGAATGGNAVPGAAPGGINGGANQQGTPPGVNTGQGIGPSQNNQSNAAGGNTSTQVNGQGQVIPNPQNAQSPQQMGGNGNSNGNQNSTGSRNNGANSNATPGGAGGAIGNTGSAAGVNPVTGSNSTTAAQGDVQGVSGTASPLGLNFLSGGSGLRVGGVLSNSIGSQAGLRAGDQVISVNGASIGSQADVQAAMQRAAQTNTPLSFSVMRNGQMQTLQGLVNGMGSTGTGGVFGSNASGGQSFADGLTIAAKAVSAAQGLSGAASNGMQVSSVMPNSWAERAGLQTNDQIMSVNGQPVGSDLQLAAQLQNAVDATGSATLSVNRNGQIVPLQVTGGAGGANNATFTPTGDFNTDFGRWAGSYTTRMQQAQTNWQTQYSQLQQFGERINALQSAIQSSTGQSADNVRMLEQLRSLRNDMGTFAGQADGSMQMWVNQMLSQLNQMSPESAVGSGTTGAVPPTGGANSAAATQAGAASSGTNTNGAATRNVGVPR